MKKLLAFIVVFTLFGNAKSQILKSGFDINEYRECICITSNFRELPGIDSIYLAPQPKTYKKIYSSPVVGFDNMWEMWQGENNVIVVSVRASVTTMKSWLSNFHAALVPAQGEFTMGKTYQYNVCDNPRARVHVGWLGAMLNMSDDIIQHIDSCYKNGRRDFILTGHSQGGAICYILTAFLRQQISLGKLPNDIRFKTYCSGAPKPGDYTFACEYEYLTRGGWAFNVINSEDWVPEVPLSVQQMTDFRDTNPFGRINQLTDTLSITNKFKIKFLFNTLAKPLKRSEKKLRKYLGKTVGNMLHNEQPLYNLATFEECANFVRTGQIIVLKPDNKYYTRHAHIADDIFEHHMYKAYYELSLEYNEPK